MNLNILILPLVWLATAHTKPSETSQGDDVSALTDQAAQTKPSENRNMINITAAHLVQDQGRQSENRVDDALEALANQGSLPIWLRAAQTQLSENRGDTAKIENQALGLDRDQERKDVLTDKLANSKSAGEQLLEDLATLEKVEEMLDEDLLELEEDILELLPQEVLEIIESNAKKAGCDRDCLVCLSDIKCTQKMIEYIPGRCHKFPGIDETDQGAISGITIDIPEIVGFIELEPLAQFNAQVDLCPTCSTRCLRGLANVRCNEVQKKWLPNRCAGFAGIFQSAVDDIEGNPYELQE